MIEEKHHHEHVHSKDCGCGIEDDKVILIEFIFLNLDTCKRTIETKINLFKAIDILKGPLEVAGYSFEIQGINIKSEADAKEFEFETSPTILVDFQDILGGIRENKCDDCSLLKKREIRCRAYAYNNLIYNVPPVGMLVEGILKGAFSGQKVIDNDNYKIPQNILNFLSGNSSK